MANKDSAMGLVPIRHKNGNPYNGMANPYYVQDGYATALYIGDPVLKVGGGANDVALTRIGGGSFPIGTLPDIQIAAAGGYITGVIVGFLPTTADSLVYGAASTHRVALVCDDPDMIFEIQEVSGGTALTEAAVGLNASFVAGTGSTTTGRSGFELDNSTEATTLDLDLRIRRLVNREDNAIGEHAKWEVSINKHSEAQGVGTAGI